MRILFFIISFFLACPAYAQIAPDIPQTSLFFSPAETRDAEKMAQQKLLAGSGDIHLGAVMYYGKDDWVLWLQNRRWTPQTTQDDLQVVDVTPTHVQIAWRDDNGMRRTLTLMPNQTYEIATGKVSP